MPLWLQGGSVGNVTMGLDPANMTCLEIVSAWDGQERCDMLTSAEQCAQEGLVDFNRLAYCTLGGESDVAIPLLAALVVIVFYTLGLTADGFLCPNMLSLSICCRMPEHIAGVTFLAFANGAPDLFSVFSAINDGPESASMAFGAAYGAALFVTTCVVGVIIFVQPFQFKRRPFVRDILLFLMASGGVFAVLHNGEVTLFEAIGLVCLYFVYVAVVGVGRAIYTTDFWQRNDPLRPKLAVAGSNNEVRPLLPSSKPPKEPSFSYTVPDEFGFGSEDEPFFLHKGAAGHHHGDSPASSFAESAALIEKNEWEGASVLSRAVQVLRIPILLVLKLTTPVVTAKDESQWCRTHYAVQCLFAPICVLFLSGNLHGTPAGGTIPDWGVALIVGAVLALGTLTVFSGDHPPVVYKWLSLVGFVVTVVWVYVIADMAVDLLSTLGMLCGVSDALIGLIVMGLGNSVGDLAANVAVAKSGHPTMAASACFGAPALNMLLGIGGSYLYVTADRGTSVIFEDEGDRLQLQSSAIFLMAVLGSIGLYVTCRNFYADRLLAVVLVVAYIAFLVSAITFEIRDS